MDRDYLKQVFAYAAISLIAVAVMIYVGYHLISDLSADVDTQPAYLDAFEEVVSGEAYILRREEVLYSSTAGVANFLVSDGAKVAVGDELADVYRSGAGDQRERIDEIDRRIKVLTEVESRAKYLSASDVNRIDKEIAELVLLARGESAGNDMSAAAAISDEILLLMNLRKIITGQVESYAAELAALKAEREGVVASLSDVAETVKSRASAYYFHTVDGYEAGFAFDDVESLTLDDLRAMTEKRPASLTGKEAGKLVYDYKWYVAMPTDEASAAYFTVGKSYDIDFGADGKTVPMTLLSIVADESATSDDAFLIFWSQNMPEGFEYTRLQPVSIKVRTYEGYRVPLSAVRVVYYGEEAVEGVYVLYGNTVVFRRIDPILTRDGYVLCRPEEEPEKDDGYMDFPLLEEPETEPLKEYETVPFLALYDLVVVSAKGMYDGKIVAN